MEDDILDFKKICRVCLNEGVMMSLFKVNISKKLMSCSSIQVWQNDGLPAQICKKCCAKLQISYQFKKLCEKSDSRLRQYINKLSQKQIVQQQPQPTEIQGAPIKSPTILPQFVDTVPENNSVYIDCNPLIETIQQENNFIPVNQTNQSQIIQIDYNQLGSFNVEGIGQVEVYNGSYTMPQEHSAVLHNPELTPAQPQQQVQFLEQHTITNNKIVKQEETKTNKKDYKLNTIKQCLTCNKAFETARKLTRHLKIHASDLAFKCKVCNKGFSHNGNLKMHLRTHTGERPFKCAVCNKGCKQAQDLKKHMTTHTGERPHKCVMCPKAFATRSNLIAHIRIHTGERPYVCCFCQKSFCQSNELTKHVRTHTGEKTHICDICHKGFNGSSTLMVHRRTHTGERPYVCLICNKAFTQNKCLAMHKRRHDDKNSKPDKVCNNRFETSTSSKHIKPLKLAKKCDNK